MNIKVLENANIIRAKISACKRQLILLEDLKTSVENGGGLWQITDRNSSSAYVSTDKISFNIAYSLLKMNLETRLTELEEEFKNL